MATRVVDKTVTSPTIPHTESFAVTCDEGHVVNVDMTADIDDDHGPDDRTHTVFTNSGTGGEIANIFARSPQYPETKWSGRVKAGCGQGEGVVLDVVWRYEREGSSETLKLLVTRISGGPF